MRLVKPVSMTDNDVENLKKAKPTKAFYKGVKEAQIAEENSHFNFDWVKKLFKN